jgi:YD repeat-containing protein
MRTAGPSVHGGRGRRWRRALAAIAFASACSCGAALAATTYTYDTLGRLVRVDYAPGNYVVYQYDPAGNRTAVGNSTSNVAPVAGDDTVTAFYNVPLTFDPRVNDFDADYDPLTISNKTNGAHGTVAVNGGGTSLTYTPAANYRGTDLFTYTIADGAGHFDTANVNVSVINRPPIANPDAITSVQRAPVTFDPRVNDTDPDGDPITITGKTDGLHGTVAVNAGTSLTYTPASTYTGPDSFTYTISDGQGNSATGAVTVTVTFDNPPIAGNNTQHIIDTYFGTPITPTGDFDLSADISDPDPGDTVTITSLTTPTHGAAAISGAHTVHYNYGTALSGAQNITVTFNYTVTDSHGLTDTGQVTVKIIISDNN